MSHPNPASRRLAGLVVLTLITASAAAAQAQDPTSLGFKKKFVIEIVNPGPVALDHHPVILDVAALRTFAPDFNTYFYALFDEAGGDYQLIVTQADDLDGDRYHDEIVFVRDLAPRSTTRLVCYYTPTRSFQLMSTPKAGARTGWEPGSSVAGWESNLAAFKFVDGRIELYGKLYDGLILRKLPADERRLQEWGMNILDPGDSAGIGGLSLWDGTSRIPLYGPAAPAPRLTVVSSGPIRALVKAELGPVATAGGAPAAVTVLFSTFADNLWSRQDVRVETKAGGPVLLGPGLKKLSSETRTLEEAKGFFASWGKTPGAGEIGLAAIFPPDDFAGLEEGPADRAVKLEGRASRTLTFWVAGSWERGITSPGVPAAQNWALRVENLAARLLSPVKVEFKSR
jgi:hypothetical protein